MNKIILFGHPRCGSSILIEILSSCLLINFEPFNKDHNKWFPQEKNYVDFVSDIESLDTQLNEIFSSHDGFKLLCFDLPSTLNLHILKNPQYKILFLRRRNLLQTMVSFYLAYETGIWQRWHNSEKEIQEAYNKIGSISLLQIKDGIRIYKDAMDRYEDEVSKRPFGYLKVFYEDLFDNNNKDVALNKVQQFLCISLNSNKVSCVLREKQKMNAIDLYKKIPNYVEIDEKLGCPETGYLIPKEGVCDVNFLI